MLTRQHSSRTRCVLTAVVATAVATATARALVRGVTGPVATVDEALVRLCVGALLCALAWGWLATLGVVAEAWRGLPGPGRVPMPLRRLVLLCCGVVLVTPLTAASADERPAPRPAPRPAIAGLPLPDRATGPARSPQPVTVPASHPASHRVMDPAAARTVVVRSGDCLWRLAAADLPDNASAARVTARWQAIHRLNAEVIGPDPDLIHPGQRLFLPPHRRTT
jgi:nucleoid-associated protein YgaU